MNVPQEIRNWAQGKLTQNLRVGPSLNGGWERWAQVDMALLWKTAAGVDVNTEAYCYGNQGIANQNNRADIVVYLAGHQHYDIIELKAWKYLADTLNTFFNTHVAADIMQVQMGLVAPYTNGTQTRWAVGLVSVAGLRHHYNANWTDAEALNYVEQHWPGVAVGQGNNAHVVDLNHVLAANGNGSAIISWCSF